MAAKVVWESLGEFTYRMKVPGGWIVKTEAVAARATSIAAGQAGQTQMGSWSLSSDRRDVVSVAMCFVPDPRHDWNTGTDTE